MNSWDTRTRSLEYLNNEKPEQLPVLLRTFSLIDAAIDAYEAHAESELYAKVCAFTLVKVKNFGVGAYSLLLDGLGQEAGALLRPFIEYVELLTYFRMFPEKTERALCNELPSAGQRARAIGGNYKKLRDYLNAHASHSSYSSYSLSHLVEGESSRLRKLQYFMPAILERNLRDFAIQLYFASCEGVLGLALLEVLNLEKLASEADAIKPLLLRAFDLDIDI